MFRPDPASTLYTLEEVVQITGYARQTLYQSRTRARKGLDVSLLPMSTGEDRRARYTLAALLEWSQRTGKPLRFDALPVRTRVSLVARCAEPVVSQCGCCDQPASVRTDAGPYCRECAELWQDWQAPALVG